MLTADQLFATLDPTTRRVELPGGRQVLFTDTVGFIQKLPTQLVAAFRATLEEVTEADALVHVVDITHKMALEQAATVEDILRELNAADKPTVIALNKIDLIPDAEAVAEALREFPQAVTISARTGKGLEDLLDRVEEALQKRLVPMRILLPYKEAELLHRLHEQGSVEREEHTEKGTLLEGWIPPELTERLAAYRVDRRSGEASTSEEAQDGA